MTEASEWIKRSNTICHYTRFWRFSKANCNGYRAGLPKMGDLLHLFAENGLTTTDGPQMRTPVYRNPHTWSEPRNPSTSRC